MQNLFDGHTFLSYEEVKSKTVVKKIFLVYEPTSGTLNWNEIIDNENQATKQDEQTSLSSNSASQPLIVSERSLPVYLIKTIYNGKGNGMKYAYCTPTLHQHTVS